eukprot:EG_transcript_19586
MDVSFLLTVVVALLLVGPLTFFVAIAFWEREHAISHPLTQELLPTALSSSTSSPAKDEDALKPSSSLKDRLRSFIFDPPEQSGTKHSLMRPTLLHWFALLYAAYGLLSVVSLALGLRRHAKNVGDWVEDMECLFLRGITLLLVGVEHRLVDRAQRGLFILLTLYSVLMYSLLFEVAPGVSIKVDVLKVDTVICLAFAAVVVGVVLAHHLLVVSRQAGLFQVLYCSALLVAITGVVTGVSHAKMHVHHYWWGWVLAHFFSLGTRASLAAQAVCVALFVHGISMFGCDRLFPENCGH